LLKHFFLALALAWTGRGVLVTEMPGARGSESLDPGRTESVAPGSPAGALEVTFVGVDRDVVGNGHDAQPDGTLDGHFRVQIDFDRWQEVSHIAVASSDAQGNPTGENVWHTQKTEYSILGVLYDDLLLNVTHVARLGKFSGGVTLDLYAADLGGFTSGSWFTVDIGMGKLEAVSALVQVGGGGPAVSAGPAQPSDEVVVGTDQPTYAPYEPIVVEFSGLPASSYDWITIVPSGTPDDQYGQWIQLQGQREGRHEFGGLPAGSYEVRAYFDWPAGGYTVQARHPFTVVDEVQ
jgi:hypothetical protein